ncbi:Histone promoter control protein 2 [Zalerion maritima]|uniref:Histone promoter control protein 2 n=1 Tax=Zalerion maritima TaxID=339359 RepID=A0AAD5RJ69_9PEZI|nr:Histone promoter control protein 2 [Zalerion maritima]
MNDPSLSVGIPPASGTRFDVVSPVQQQHDPSVPLTKAGLPRKKPGRKPGSTVKPRDPDSDAAKARKPRKPRDPNAPPIQRKRKAPPTAADGPTSNAVTPDDVPSNNHSSNPLAAAAAAGTSLSSFADAAQSHQPRMSDFTDMRMAASRSPAQSGMMNKVPKRESMPSSMQNILNSEPDPSPPAPTVPPARSVFDPVRGSYDPVRETMMARDPYGTASLGSPRATQAQTLNRASASPSIASLVDGPVPQMRSPVSSFNVTQPHAAASRQEPTSMPTSPSHPIRTAQHAVLAAPNSTSTMTAANNVHAANAALPIQDPAQPKSHSTSSASASGPAANKFAAASAKQPTKPIIKPVVRTLSESKKQPPLPPPVPTLKPDPPTRQTGTGSILGLLKKSSPKQTSVASSSPHLKGVKEPLPALPDSSNPLDFGKVQAGDTDGTSIVLRIALNGQTNKYVNFMQMAEERYGWDALHPRAAAQRDRKARIAAATSALAQAGSGRESGDEMSDDVSEGENSGAGGLTSGAEAKPVKKKRNFKEDEYDKDDDFVDDSEMLWEEQAAASRDGFFVYSGPLVPEAPKSPIDPVPKRGRGSRGGRGGGRGAGTGRGGGPGSRGGGTGRGGGPGSRGGQVRKPRITKAEKEQRERDERDRLAALASGTGLMGGANPFAAGMAGN